jgi:hypothetical protein
MLRKRRATLYQELTPAGRIQAHDHPDWSPVLFKEPIQGRKLATNANTPGPGRSQRGIRSLHRRSANTTRLHVKR